MCSLLQCFISLKFQKPVFSFELGASALFHPHISLLQVWRWVWRDQRLTTGVPSVLSHFLLLIFFTDISYSKPVRSYHSRIFIQVYDWYLYVDDAAFLQCQLSELKNNSICSTPRLRYFISLHRQVYKPAWIKDSSPWPTSFDKVIWTTKALWSIFCKNYQSL